LHDEDVQSNRSCYDDSCTKYFLSIIYSAKPLKDSQSIVVAAHKKCFELQTPEEIFAERFTNFFSIAINDGCLDEAEKQLSEIMRQVGIEIKAGIDKNFYESLKTFIDTLNTPNVKQCDLEKIVEAFIESVTKFVQSQRGLEDFPNCEKLRKNPENREFFSLYDKLSDFTRNIAGNPGPASVYFNAEIAKAYARFGVLFGEISTRYRSIEKNSH
jgi:hypothetical protein